MRLLITTQVVDRNDSDLGFFHAWIAEFAKHCESVEVICLYEGEHALPANVQVHSLGKELGAVSGWEYAWRFKMLIWKLRKEYDAVFVHMNPEYVILGSFLWHLWKKRVSLWYLHKSVNLKLRVAVSMADVVFTASKESLRLKSAKVRIVGHGIALEVFKDGNHAQPVHAHGLRVVTVGRISPAKNVPVLIDAVEILRKNNPALTFEVIGTAGRPEEKSYEASLIQRVAESSSGASVRFLGGKTHEEVAALLPQYDLFLHASTGTGSVDKAVLEALLSGVPVVSSSPAFRQLLSPYGLFVEENAAAAIAAAATAFLGRIDQQQVRSILREKVAREYALSALIPKIISMLQ